MTEIQVLLYDDANCRAVASLLNDHHTPLIDDDVQDAELYIVDDLALPQYRDALMARKREEEPIFCPAVLIRNDHTPITIDLPDPVTSDPPLLVDEVVTAPVTKQGLLRTIKNLLVRRQQTAELTVELRERNERLERFASTLTHELRNPVTILDGYLDLARETGTDEAFESCQTAVDRIKRMIEDTILVVQGDTNPSTFEPVDLPAVVEECWEMISNPDAQLEIATTQQISADEDYLRQLLENLIRNAVEHGGSEVTVTVGDLADGFYVEDDGVGVPESELDRVFEEGYSTSRAGSGIGLAVVNAVVDAHRWNLTLTERRNGGARFEIADVDCVAADDP